MWAGLTPHRTRLGGKVRSFPISRVKKFGSTSLGISFPDSRADLGVSLGRSHSHARGLVPRPFRSLSATPMFYCHCGVGKSVKSHRLSIWFPKSPYGFFFP